MPRLTGLLETALYVDNLERSADFYRSLFDFRVLVADARLVALAVPASQVLLLFKKGGSLGGAPGGTHDGDGQTHMAFAIPAEEFDAWEKRLQQQGIAITERRTWDLGGRSLYFRDPDENLIELATPGTWATY